MMHLTILQKQEQTKSQINRAGLVKITPERNEIETKK
jgi:hypothetical protein